MVLAPLIYFSLNPHSWLPGAFPVTGYRKTQARFMRSMLAPTERGWLHSNPWKTVVKEDIPRGKTWSSTSYCPLHVEGEWAYFLSEYNVVGRDHLSQSRVSLWFLFYMPKMQGPDPLYLGHLSSLYLQGAALRDEMLSPSGTESRLARKDVNSQSSSIPWLQWKLALSTEYVHPGPSAWPLWDLGMWGTHANMLMMFILPIVLLTSRKWKRVICQLVSKRKSHTLTNICYTLCSWFYKPFVYYVTCTWFRIEGCKSKLFLCRFDSSGKIFATFMFEWLIFFFVQAKLPWQRCHYTSVGKKTDKFLWLHETV